MTQPPDGDKNAPFLQLSDRFVKEHATSNIFRYLVDANQCYFR